MKYFWDAFSGLTLLVVVTLLEPWSEPQVLAENVLESGVVAREAQIDALKPWGFEVILRPIGA